MLKSCILVFFSIFIFYPCIQPMADAGFLGQRMEQDAVLQHSLVWILCTFLLPARPASSPPSPRLSRGCGERGMRGEVRKKEREKRLICSFTGAAVQLSPSLLPDSLSSSILRTSAPAVCSSSSFGWIVFIRPFSFKVTDRLVHFSGLGLPVWMSLESFHYQSFDSSPK